MIRVARFQDAPAIEAMVREMHVASKYQGRAAVCDKALAQVVLGMIAGQGSTGPQGTFCSVAEERGRVVGFMAGLLDRIYHVGDRLVANDVFLYVRPHSGFRHSLALIDAYVRWARANRKVLEIKLSWNDALPGAERIGEVYARKGFERVGEIFEMKLDRALEQAA